MVMILNILNSIYPGPGIFLHVFEQCNSSSYAPSCTTALTKDYKWAVQWVQCGACLCQGAEVRVYFFALLTKSFPFLRGNM